MRFCASFSVSANECADDSVTGPPRCEALHCQFSSNRDNSPEVHQHALQLVTRGRKVL